MKKNLVLLVILLIYSNFLNSQNEPAFILEDENGIVIENNQLLEVITTEYPNASFNFFVRMNPTKSWVILCVYHFWFTDCL